MLMTAATPDDAPITLRGAPAALVALLAVARAQGVSVSRTKAAKLLYLADLEAVDRIEAAHSGVTWRWWHYGPFSASLIEAEDGLVQEAVIQRETRENYHGSPEYRLRLGRPVPLAVDKDYLKVLEDTVQRYGRLAASTLRDITYQTPPMQEAQRVGHRGVILELTTGRTVPDVEPALRKFDRVLARLGRGEDEPGAEDELADEVVEWTDARLRANSTILE
jgi:uncharacterized phage-associated protein